MERNPKLWDTRKGASILNEHRDDVITSFREGKALAAIGRLYNMSASAVMYWLRAQGEYDRRVTCELPGCRKQFPFRPRKRYCCRLHVRRANAAARAARPEEKLKVRARNKLHKAVFEGVVVRPERCERCGGKPSVGKDGRSLLQADHHRGYDEDYALDVWWICHTCDAEVEKLRRSGKTVNKDNIH